MKTEINPKSIAIISLIALAGMLFGSVAYLANYSKIKVPVAINSVKKDVVITTDKKEYEQGENIKLIINKKGSENAFLTFNVCTSDQSLAKKGPSKPSLQALEGSTWVDLNWDFPTVSPTCLVSLKCSSDFENTNFNIPTSFLDLKGEKHILSGINRIKLEFGKSCQKNIGLNDTFVIYSNEFTIKEKTVQDQNVSIATDKPEYEQGEIIKIIVSNGLDQSILYSDSGDRFWDIEYSKDDKWINVDYEEGGGFQLTEKNIGDTCNIVSWERMSPNELSSQSDIASQWNQKICPFGTEGPDKPRIVGYTESGKYRLVFYYGFEISGNDLFEISESRAVYSNKFTINEQKAPDPRCKQKVEGMGLCKMIKDGYEFNASENKCVKRTAINGCSFEIPFDSLEDCKEICEAHIETGNELEFETIMKGSNGFMSERKNYIIRSNQEWLDLLGKNIDKIDSVLLSLPVDFKNEMIFAIFQGEKPTGGYSIEITKIIENKDNTEVFVKETSPGVNCMVTKSLISPFHIVKLQKIDKEVVFKIEKANDCN